MAKIEGVAKKFDGTAIDYVSIFKWEDGQCVVQKNPSASGAWEYSRHNDLLIGITYVADGCAPITHGPYQYQYTGSENLLTNGHFDNDLSGWDNQDNHYKWVDGRAHHPRGSSYKEFTQLIGTHGLVRITADIEVLSGRAQYLIVSGGSVIHPAKEFATGNHKIDFIAQVDANSFLHFARVASTGTVEFYVDNVVVVKV